jgi:hypothetical protein
MHMQMPSVKHTVNNIGKRLAKHADASELENINTVITSGLQIMQMPPL